MQAATTEQIDAFRAYLRCTGTDGELTPVYDAARLLVARYVGRAAGLVPDEILTLAVHKVGSELWAARDAVGGIVTGYTDMGSGLRLARDPMVAARPILAPYVGLGIG